MKGWLIDSYRADNKIILWIKTLEGRNERIEQEWKTIIYAEESSAKFFARKNLPFRKTYKKTYLGDGKTVLEISISEISSFEKLIGDIEKSCRHRISLYNADVAPEQSFLYHHGICPGQLLEIEDGKICKIKSEEYLKLKECIISIRTEAKKIIEIRINNEILYAGDDGEAGLLKEFSRAFYEIDPDVIRMEYAFSKIPFLDEKFRELGIESPFHRWDKTPLKYKGNKTFYSYGRTILRDFAVRLKGRILIDTSTAVGYDCDTDSILELASLTGTRIQQIASRSFGAVFQQSLVRLMYEKNMLIPYKEKPVDVPITMLDMLSGDSGGHRFDPKVGYHENVAEIDFSSMYPWIIYNKNISADMMLTKNEPLERVPRLSFYISHTHKGLVPLAIKPLLDKRMEYKRNPTLKNKQRAKGIKCVLVTAYGYARFREFKLGLASSHMAICSYAREIILESARIAEQDGFRIIHGVVDSLFLKKKGMTKDDVLRLMKKLENRFNIPISYEGIFKWIVFLPSINDIKRPLPSTYYGAFEGGGIKARGIEMRQQSKPLIIRHFQKEIIEEFSKCACKKEMLSLIPQYAKKIREIIEGLCEYSPEMLVHRISLSKTDYKSNNAQSQIIRQMKKEGIVPAAGQAIAYAVTENGAVLPEKYRRNPLKEHYRKMLEKALFNLIQPFGIALQEIKELSQRERQTRICEWTAEKTASVLYENINEVQNPAIVVYR